MTKFTEAELQYIFLGFLMSLQMCCASFFKITSTQIVITSWVLENIIVSYEYRGNVRVSETEFEKQIWKMFYQTVNHKTERFKTTMLICCGWLNKWPEWFIGRCYGFYGVHGCSLVVQKSPPPAQYSNTISRQFDKLISQQINKK